MEDVELVFSRLLTAYGVQHWWPAQSPYEMMVGAILTQNTAWTNVEKALSALGKALTPEYIARCELGELAEKIRPSGYFNQKAERLKLLTKWFSQYDYDISRARKQSGNLLRRELLAVKGIGPETADSILLYALDKAFFVVDAYTRRIFTRLGFIVPQGYDEFRLSIERLLPRDISVYNEFHALLVIHSKSYCLKQPKCIGCPLGGICQCNLSRTDD